MGFGAGHRRTWHANAQAGLDPIFRAQRHGARGGSANERRRFELAREPPQLSPLVLRQPVPVARSLLRMPEPLRDAGVVVMWLGIALRAWAIVALGAAFRTTVEVDPGQAVIARGPYRWIRHPSYTGLLVIVAGFGLVAGSW